MFPFILVFRLEPALRITNTKAAPVPSQGQVSCSSSRSCGGAPALLGRGPRGGSPLFSAEADPYTCLRFDKPLQGIFLKKKKTPSLRKKTAPAKSAKHFRAVFAALKNILTPYEKRLSVVRYKPEFY